MTVIDWLLDSDPSIRWQVLRDLTGAPAEEVAAERARVATEGAGARLLALQGADGRWGGAAWNRGWNSTMHVLMLLRDHDLAHAGRHERRRHRIAGRAARRAAAAPAARRQPERQDARRDRNTRHPSPHAQLPYFAASAQRIPTLPIPA